MHVHENTKTNHSQLSGWKYSISETGAWLKSWEVQWYVIQGEFPTPLFQKKNLKPCVDVLVYYSMYTIILYQCVTSTQIVRVVDTSQLTTDPLKINVQRNTSSSWKEKMSGFALDIF